MSSQCALMPVIAGKVMKLPRQVRRNGIQSANKQVEAKAEQFVIRQRPPALDLRLHAIGDDIIPRILLAIFNYGFEIGDHVVRRPQQRLYIRRSEEHTSELQSLMRISYAVFCLKKKTQNIILLIFTTRPNTK